jgi:hypothetical protein
VGENYSLTVTKCLKLVAEISVSSDNTFLFSYFVADRHNILRCFLECITPGNF